MSASLNVTAQDIAVIQQVGHDSIVAIVALVVEAVLYSELIRAPPVEAVP
jgi:hypothetical protein